MSKTISVKCPECGCRQFTAKVRLTSKSYQNGLLTLECARADSNCKGGASFSTGSRKK